MAGMEPNEKEGIKWFTNGDRDIITKQPRKWLQK
jgi:hypothetical protein